MVTQQNDDLSVTFGRLLFQCHQQIHDLAIFGSTIKHVPRLHQGCIPTRPMVLVVNDLQFLKNRHQGIEVTMNVAHGQQTG